MKRSGPLFALAMALMLMAFAGQSLPLHAQAPPPASGGSMVISTVVTTAPAYEPYGAGSSAVEVKVNITGLNLAAGQDIQFLSSFKPSSDRAVATEGNSSQALTVSVTPGHFGNFYGYDFVIPKNATSVTMSITGYSAGTAFLWRYIQDLPSVSVAGWSGSVLSSTQLVIPAGSQVSQVFDSFGTTLASSALVNKGPAGGTIVYTVAGQKVGSVILQSDYFAPAATVFTAVAVVAVALLALGYLRPGQALFARLEGRAKASLSSASASGTRLLPRGALNRISLRKLMRPKTLLILFVACAVLMVALGAAGGPDPHVKAYVVADQSNVQAITNSLSGTTGNGISVITPYEDYSDFGVMSSVGQFNMVVISNYPALSLPQINEFVVPNLGNVPVIVLDKTADPTISTQVNALYHDNVVLVQNARALNQSELQEISSLLTSTGRSNALGVNMGFTSFRVVLTAEAILSFVLIFIGWAYLGCLVSDSGAEGEVAHLVTVVASGVFVFVFSEMIYVETSLLLAFPLSLHAVISGAKDITAVGLLGFGGGSTPRLAAGFLGVMVGVIFAENRPKINRADFAFLIAVPIVLLANPFFIGNFAFQAVLLFVGNFSLGTAFTTSLSFKGFIYGVGAVFGGSLNPTYLMSAGKILYFAGLIPLAFLRRMGRTTTVLAVLVGALFVGDGGVRVGEMTPTKTVIAVFPGLAVGFAIFLCILALAVIEKQVRRAR